MNDLYRWVKESKPLVEGKPTMKTFEQFISEFGNPYDDESFLEKFGDNVIYDMEKKLASQGFKIDPDSVWQSLEDLGLYEDFENEMEKLVSGFSNKLYFTAIQPNEFDEPDAGYTEEYLRIRREHDSQKKGFGFSYRSRDFERTLLRNAIEKNWEAWRSFYRKWIDIVHSKRGQLTAKKFGL